MEKSQYLLLQVNDALFPIGGYAHSYGLETYVQKGIVHDIETSGDYIKKSLLYKLCYTDLFAVRLAYEYTQKHEWSKLLELDEMLTAVKGPKEIRHASYKLAARFLKTVKAFNASYEEKEISIYLDGYQKKHLVTVYGAFCQGIGADYHMAITTFLYAQTSAMVTNCVKLVPLSQTAGQQLLYSCYPVFEQVKDILPKLNLEDFGASAPGFDIRSMQHEELYSRLYMS